MQHDDRRRLIRRRPVGYRLQAFAVGEDVAGRPRSMERRSLHEGYAAGSSFRARSGCAEPAAPGAWRIRVCGFRLEFRRRSEGKSRCTLSCMAGLVLRSASTCLLIVLPLSWYISDGTKLQFRREGGDAHESTMRYERSRPLKVNREDSGPPSAKPAGRSRFPSIQLICAQKWPGRLTRRSHLSLLAHDEARLSL